MFTERTSSITYMSKCLQSLLPSTFSLTVSDILGQGLIFDTSSRQTRSRHNLPAAAMDVGASTPRHGARQPQHATGWLRTAHILPFRAQSDTTRSGDGTAARQLQYAPAVSQRRAGCTTAPEWSHADYAPAHAPRGGHATTAWDPEVRSKPRQPPSTSVDACARTTNKRALAATTRLRAHESSASTAGR